MVAAVAATKVAVAAANKVVAEDRATAEAGQAGTLASPQAVAEATIRREASANVGPD